MAWLQEQTSEFEKRLFSTVLYVSSGTIPPSSSLNLTRWSEKRRGVEDIVALLSVFETESSRSQDLLDKLYSKVVTAELTRDELALFIYQQRALSNSSAVPMQEKESFSKWLVRLLLFVLATC